MSAGGARRGRRDNGLDAAEYAVAGDVDPRVGEHLLDVLAAGGIAAYLLPASDINPVTRTTTFPARPTDRLYVDRTHLATARDYLSQLAADEHGLTGRQPNRHRDADESAGGNSPDIEAEWARIVAGFHTAVDPTNQPWPDAENLDPPARGTSTGGRRRGDRPGDDQRRGRRRTDPLTGENRHTGRRRGEPQPGDAGFTGRRRTDRPPAGVEPADVAPESGGPADDSLQGGTPAGSGPAGSKPTSGQPRDEEQPHNGQGQGEQNQVQQDQDEGQQDQDQGEQRLGGRPGEGVDDLGRSAGTTGPTGPIGPAGLTGPGGDGTEGLLGPPGIGRGEQPGKPEPSGWWVEHYRQPAWRTANPSSPPPDEPSLLDALDSFGLGLPDDDEGYIPPPPPPLPHFSKYGIAATLAVFGGFVLFIFPQLIPLDSDVVMLFGFTCILTGFVTWVWRLRPGDDEEENEDPDNGAVV